MIDPENKATLNKVELDNSEIIWRYSPRTAWVSVDGHLVAEQQQGLMGNRLNTIFDPQIKPEAADAISTDSGAFRFRPHSHSQGNTS